MLLTAANPLRAIERLCRLERLFGDRRKGGEALLIEHRDVREDLAVDLDLRRLRPFISRLYDKPFARAAALIRVIQSARNSRLRTRRSRNAYWPALMTACFAARYTLRRAL